MSPSFRGSRYLGVASLSLRFFATLIPFAVLSAAPAPVCTEDKTLHAQVVAIEQVYVWNRYESFNPSGMMYALRNDVVHLGNSAPESSRHPLTPGNVKLRGSKRPRPIVLRVNEGECLHIEFQNLLTPAPPGPDEQIRRKVPAHLVDPGENPGQKAVNAVFSADPPHTRAASLHVNGLDYVNIEADAANVGRNISSLALPGEKRDYWLYGRKEGTYFLYSMGAPLGGEGDGGQLGLGLFGALIVEPKHSVWYKSQITHDELASATTARPAADYSHYAAIDYDKFAMVAKVNGHRHLLHSDLNAVVRTDPTLPATKDCIASNDGKTPTPKTAHLYPFGSSCGRSFREFTVIFHDEIKAVQAFPELNPPEDGSDESKPLASVKDGMAINYGASGMGAMFLANRKKIGPTKNCPECLYEEFFLTSWANGDPALVVDRDRNNVPVRAKYPDDPSNVHHSYLGDPVVFRAIHAGPKETHVFHLHAHQWLLNREDPNSHYLDSQTVSPGSAFTYEIWYGGSGNRNLTAGDSIFHCHLYPHFAQGMWELWRVHDVFEDGKQGRWFDPTGKHGGSDPTVRNVPDPEIRNGVATPALLPIPGLPLAPPPTKEFAGYPFFIPATVGHRPPQPPMDFEKTGGVYSDGGLPRHIVLEGAHSEVNPELIKKGGPIAELTARRVLAQTGTPAENSYKNSLFVSEMKDWAWMKLELIDNDGTPTEKKAMDFHAGNAPWLGASVAEKTQYMWNAKGYKRPIAGNSKSGHPWDQNLFLVNGQGKAPGGPFANPCPADLKKSPRLYDGAFLQFGMTVNRFGWHDPQARISLLTGDINDIHEGKKLPEPFFFRAHSNDCIEYHITNLVPNALNLDDFQIYSPTDTIGQHIHLVKFDVMTADGSGNGFNYEDATYSPDEVRERIKAYNIWLKNFGPSTARQLQPKTHRLFSPNGPLAAGRADNAVHQKGLCADKGGDDDDFVKHPWCGAQTSIQRWFADPLYTQHPVNAAKKPEQLDKTIRTVFTHDHMGPSSHQQHGLYAALVVEPAGSTWTMIQPGEIKLAAFENSKRAKNSQLAQPPACDWAVARCDGGPTSFMANITVPENRPAWTKEKFREFNLAFADFAIVYTRDLLPVNRPNKDESGIFRGHAPGFVKPRPEAISTEDPGTQLLNYRNEPIPLRISESKNYWGIDSHKQRNDARGDMANVFSSEVHQNLTSELKKPLPPRIDNVFLNLPNFNQAGLNAAFNSLEQRRQQFVNLLEAEPGRLDGDPSTPILPVRAGDRAQIRLIQGAQEEQHTFTVNGLRWPESSEALVGTNPKDPGYVNAQPIGISEHFEFDVDTTALSYLENQFKKLAPTELTADRLRSTRAGIDHLLYSSSTENLWDGQWGILRKLAADRKTNEVSTLQPPPTADKSLGGNSTGDAICPTGTKKTLVVGAFRACDLLDNCKSIAPGVKYNPRFDLYDPAAIVYAEQPESLDAADRADALAWHRPLYKAGKTLEPLVLRASAGQCLAVILNNYLDANPSAEPLSYNYMPPIVEGLNFNQVKMSNSIGLTAQLVTTSTYFSDGSAVGYNETSLVKPGGSALYHWYAGDHEVKNSQPVKLPRELGVVALRSFGDPIKHSSHGAVGALVIEPEDASWTFTGKDGKPCKQGKDPNDPCWAANRTSATVNYAATKGPRSFQEFVTIIQDDLSLQQAGQPLPNLRLGEDSEDSGAKGLNYRTEPIWARAGFGTPAVDFSDTNSAEFCAAFSSVLNTAYCANTPKTAFPDEPVTPIFEATAGDEVRFRVVHAGGHQRQHAFALFGHNWDVRAHTPNNRDDSPVSNLAFKQMIMGAYGGIGPARHLNVVVRAGGECGVPGDYLFKSQPSFLSDGGIWGIFRVKGAHAPSPACANVIAKKTAK